MSNTKLWDVSELTFKIIFSNLPILHATRNYSQKGLSDLSKGHTAINGTEKMRTQVSWLLAQWFFHYIALQSTTTNYATAHDNSRTLLCTTLCCSTLQYTTLPYHTSLCCTILSCNKLYHTAQHYITPHTTVLLLSLFCTIIYYTTVHYTKSHMIILKK